MREHNDYILVYKNFRELFQRTSPTPDTDAFSMTAHAVRKDGQLLGITSLHHARAYLNKLLCQAEISPYFNQSSEENHE